MHLRTIAAASLLLASITLRAEEPQTFDVHVFKFTRPAEWQWVEVSSPMRKAQLAVPGKDGAAPADITFFHFGPGGAGGVQANVDRWFAQFAGDASERKSETKEVNGTKITFVTTKGTFNDTGMRPGGPATPRENYALHGAILEDDGGPVFVKMTGPEAVVKEAGAKFVEFVTAAAAAKK